MLLKDLVKTIRTEPNTVIESYITNKFGHGYKKGRASSCDKEKRQKYGKMYSYNFCCHSVD